MDEPTERSGIGDISGAIRRAIRRKRESREGPTAGSAEPATSNAPNRLASPVDPLIIGESATTFGSEPWWTEKNWNRLPSSGGTNGFRIHNGVIGNLAVCGGSMRGRRHQLAGQPNDDSFDIVTVSDAANEPAWLVVAVCDGVGSAAYSNTGASSTASHAAALIAHSLRANPNMTPKAYAQAFSTQCSQFLSLLTGAVNRHLQSFNDRWMQELEFTPPTETSLDELQTTLTVLVLRAIPDEAGRHEGAIISVGDSPTLRLCESAITPLEPVIEDAAIWSTATNGALGADTAVVQLVDIASGCALMVATDGVANFLTHHEEPTALGTHMMNSWRTPIDTATFVRDLSFDLASADDDRTAVMVWVRDSAKKAQP